MSRPVPPSEHCPGQAPESLRRRAVHKFAGIAALISMAFVSGCEPFPNPGTLALVPQPREVASGRGSFTFDRETVIHVASGGDHARRAAEIVLAEIRASTGLPLAVSGAREAPRNALVLGLYSDTSDAESYRLQVRPARVTVSAPGEPGLFYGLQTLRQLMPPAVESAAATDARDTSSGVRYAVPVVDISDAPRFSYRGLHLDVGRHFFPTAFIKRYLDLMARYKLNRFHWHLTEDQGWRIEIKAYPRLTEVGSVRKETILEKNFDPYVGDGVPHGGFYTQEEVREVVAYATERHITIVPEIEMPGHSTAALAAYPELACSEGPFEVSTIWGVKDDIYCPSEATFAFLENVLDEVLALFPGEMIHIGGDEVPKRRWEESPLARRVIEREGLRDESELQSWFIRRIEAFLNERGRRLIGWDEILEGGLAPNATVMSWRGIEGGIEAARQGHDVVMTPNTHLYLDYFQGPREEEPLAIGGYLPLDTVYAFEPVPDVLTPEEARHVLGAQANVWTEYIKTPAHVEYMTFPRAIALAEVVWSPAELRDAAGFRMRLAANLRHLDALDVNYRPLDTLEPQEEDGP